MEDLPTDSGVTPSASYEQKLTNLRNSIIHKPPFTSGSLQLSLSDFSLFYKINTHDAPARSVYLDLIVHTFRTLYYHRYVNFADITPHELEQLTQACQPATFGVNKEEVMDETYRKAGKMDTDCFSTTLIPEHTDLIKIVRNYLLEGTDTSRQIKAELYKLNVYGTRLIHVHD
jgi:hypothetical protein